MPSKEIKALRKTGKLEEAYDLAKEELDKNPDNIWSKRNLSWVYYEYLKVYNSGENFDEFTKVLQQITDLNLPENEEMFFENIAWQIGKMGFALARENPINYKLVLHFFNQVKEFSFPKPSESYTFLFKAFHKLFKGIPQYLEMMDWWGFENFRPEDYEKEVYKGKPMMPMVERAYNAYAKQFLAQPEGNFKAENAENLIKKLSKLIEAHPDYQFPTYYKSKLLLRLGKKKEMLSSFLPFAKKKKNDFWVWEVLGKAFSEDKDKIRACLCKALTCKSPEEMLVSVRQELAELLVQEELYSEAKTEILAIIKVKEEKDWKIPIAIQKWVKTSWYKETKASKSNKVFYRNHLELAEELLFGDNPKETVIVEFVNSKKKVLNFIASEKKFGFFKYDRFLKDVQIGNTLNVRFSHGSVNGFYHVLAASKYDDEEVKKKFLKEVEGVVRISGDNTFGFVNHVFLHPTFIKKHQLKDGAPFKGTAIKSYNSKKKEWGWKMIS